jgi:hypothetical protein
VVDGSNHLGSVTTYTFSNVIADHTINAIFGQLIAAGPMYPQTVTDNGSYGNSVWTIPAGALLANDTNNASVSLGSTLSGNNTSHYLSASNFGFAIPPGATILGITVEIDQRASNTSNVTDSSVRIVKNGAIQSTDKATSTTWGTSDSTQSYGGNNDLWGTTWNASDINNATTGVVFAADNSNFLSTRTAYIDFIRMTVYYNLTGTPTATALTSS